MTGMGTYFFGKKDFDPFRFNKQDVARTALDLMTAPPPAESVRRDINITSSKTTSQTRPDNIIQAKRSDSSPTISSGSSTHSAGSESEITDVRNMNWDISDPIRFKENTKPEKAEVTRGVVAARVLTTIASLSLGVMAGLAIVGIMTTPAGWAIAGAALCIGLVGAYHYGGVEQLFIAAQLGMLSFLGGLAAATGFGQSTAIGYFGGSLALIVSAVILRRLIDEKIVIA